MRIVRCLPVLTLIFMLIQSSLWAESRRRGATSPPPQQQQQQNQQQQQRQETEPTKPAQSTQATHRSAVHHQVSSPASGAATVQQRINSPQQSSRRQPWTTNRLPGGSSSPSYSLPTTPTRANISNRRETGERRATIIRQPAQQENRQSPTSSSATTRRQPWTANRAPGSSTAPTYSQPTKPTHPTAYVDRSDRDNREGRDDDHRAPMTRRDTNHSTPSSTAPRPTWTEQRGPQRTEIRGDRDDRTGDQRHWTGRNRIDDDRINRSHRPRHEAEKSYRHSCRPVHRIPICRPVPPPIYCPIPVPVWYPPPTPEVIVITERVEVPGPYPAPPRYLPPPDNGDWPIEGAEIWAADGTFLGIINFEQYDPYSIANPEGRFGHPQSPESIWNYDDRFGSSDYDLSPWCEWATRPPQLILDGKFLGYLTINETIYPRVDPYWLAEYLGMTF